MKMKAVALNSIGLGDFEAGELPERILLLPAGQVEGRDGRKWLNSEPQVVLESFAGLGRDLPVDVEHATELRAPKGEPAPAAAWIKALNNEGGAIWGEVEWLDVGRQLVGGRQYRYHSPVILYRPSDRVITGLTSVGLTNQPNLRLGALNSEQDGEEQIMDELKKVKVALGLTEDADTEQILNAIAKLKGDLASAMNRAETPDLAKFVPRGDYDQVMARAVNAEQALAEDQKKRLDAEIENEINAALTAGKITPATVEYHKASCRQEDGLERFRDFVKAAPVLAGESGLDDKKAGEPGKAMNAQEQAVAAMFGNTAEDIAKYGN